MSNKDVLSIHKRLFRSTISKRNWELEHVSKELSQSGTFLSKQLSTVDFYICNRSITSYNKKLLQKLLNTQHKKLSSLMRNCSLPTFTSNKTITNLTQYELSQEESYLLLKQVYISLSNQIKFECPKSSLPLKRFIVCLSATLNPKKLKIR